MSNRDNYVFANKWSEERSAPGIVLEGQNLQAETFSGRGDPNADPSSDGENSAVGISSDENGEDAESHHEAFYASSDSSSDGEYERVSSRSLSELL
jgi:hypothetical protein